MSTIIERMSESKARKKSKANIKVSVVIPVYNTEKYVGECLDSLLAQTMMEWEAVCVDDGSTDGSLSVEREYAAKDSRVKVIELEQNAGQALARNVGLAAAQGDYVYFLDSDDMVAPEGLEELSRIAEENQLDGLLFNHSFKFETPELEKRIHVNRFRVGKELADKGVLSGEEMLIASELDRFDHVQPGRYLWQRSYLLEHNIKNIQETVLHEDNYFAVRAMAEAGAMMAVAKDYHIRRYRENSVMTGTSAETMAKHAHGFFVTWAELLDYLKAHEFRMDDCRKRCFRYTEQMLKEGLKLYKKIPVQERSRVKFKNPAHQILFELAVKGESEGQVPQPPKVQPQKQVGLLVYGVGNHLFDMLDWHPDLGRRIARIFDKDKAKQGTKVAGIGKPVEPPEALKSLPQGTLVAISAIRYLDEITQELYQLNSGLVCEDIDVVYERLDELLVAPPDPKKQPAKQSVMSGLTGLQKQRLRGREAQARWRQRFLMECAGARRIFWGSLGVRASFLRRKFLPLMGPGDIYIEEDLSRRGQMQDGLPICIPDALKDIKGNVRIIVLSGNYAAVRERLTDYGYVENVDFVEGRSLIGEDENGYIDVPCIDKADAGMIVYGLGAHLADMLRWHPELAGKITRVIDKDTKKVGTIVDKVGVQVEPPEVLRDLPAGTEVAVSAIKYLEDIKKDIHALQPGLICRNIDQIWREYV